MTSDESIPLIDHAILTYGHDWCVRHGWLRASYIPMDHRKFRRFSHRTIVGSLQRLSRTFAFPHRRTKNINEYLLIQRPHPEQPVIEEWL